MSRVNRLLSWYLGLGLRSRLLLATWSLFAILVACRIHGSSINLAARLWDSGNQDRKWLAAPLLNELPGRQQMAMRSWLMTEPSYIRGDEWGISTLWSLGQISHRPQFPVINTNIGAGQNMLLIPSVPVWHLSALARPVTWGFLLFGREPGLAWAWWSQTFLCFTGLLLLFEIVVRDTRLAAFGAFWFCGSAYVVCWSQWPANALSFAALGFVAAYWLLTQTTPWKRWASGGLLGLAAVGFVLQLYPPWLIPIGYAFGAVFVALVYRDRLWRGLVLARWLPPLLFGVLVAVIVLATFYASAHTELHYLANSVYPGTRRLHGGDCSLARLFGGFYNAFTIRNAPMGIDNESEAAGFFLFFPVIAVALLLSRRMRSRMDPVAWTALGICLILTVFAQWGFPRWLANVTLMSRAQGYRAQVAVGFASILVCLFALLPGREEVIPSRLEPYVAPLLLLSSIAFFVWQGAQLQKIIHLFSSTALIPKWVWVVSLLASVLSLLLYFGRPRPFVVAIVLALFLTAGDFNPLMVGFSSPFTSELGEAVGAIVRKDREEGRHSYWMGLGGTGSPEVGTLLAALGARSLTGAFHHPQPELWKTFDPDGANKEIHNRFAITHFLRVPLSQKTIWFEAPRPTLLQVGISPLNPVFRTLGTRYILTQGTDVNIVSPPFTLLFRSRNQQFAIWEMPL